MTASHPSIHERMIEVVAAQDVPWLVFNPDP